MSETSNGARRGGIFAAFSIRSFRFQWSADVLSTWGFEMESLILGWYILIETESALLVAAVGALRFGGTLISPLVGVVADRFARRTLMVWMRALFSVLCLGIIVTDSMGALGPLMVLLIAGTAGLLRPAEHIIRNSLIADTVPKAHLVNAVGFSRTTNDTARIFGALAGAGLLASVGIGKAYMVITVMYLLAMCLTFGITLERPRPGATRATPWRDLRMGLRYVRQEKIIHLIMWLALLANVTAFPLTHGLLPVIAKDLYGLDELGLALMTALAALGSLAGSLFVAFMLRSRRVEPYMLWALVVWHLLVVAFALTPPSWLGWVILAAIGVASSTSMVTMAVALLDYTSAEFRGRVQGVRMLAVYGLPLGLLTAGMLIENISLITTLVVYGSSGFLLALWATLKWSSLTRSVNSYH